jgi:hypothetical protein
MNFLTVLMICAASLELCHAARYKINGTASPPQGHGQENGFSESEVEVLYEEGKYIPRNDVNTLSARNSTYDSESEDSSEEYFDFSDYILKDDSGKDSDDDPDDSDDDSDYSDDNK